MATDEKLIDTLRQNFMPVRTGCPCADLDLDGPRLRLELVSAHERPDVAAICYHNKLACYSRFGAAAASMPLPAESQNRFLHLVTATDCRSQAIVGSVSIYKRDDASTLPIEKAIGSADAMKREIESWRSSHIVELSGLWTEDVWRKTGLSEQLLHASIASAHVLQAEKIVAFGHHHLVQFYETVGLLQELRLGHFSYPNRDYVSSVLWADPCGFLTVPADKRASVKGYAKTLASRKPILWQSFHERVALTA